MPFLGGQIPYMGAASSLAAKQMVDMTFHKFFFVINEVHVFDRALNVCVQRMTFHGTVGGHFVELKKQTEEHHEGLHTCVGCTIW